MILEAIVAVALVMVGILAAGAIVWVAKRVARFLATALLTPSEGEE